MVGVGVVVVHEPGILFYLLCTGIFVCGRGDGGKRGVASEYL